MFLIPAYQQSQAPGGGGGGSTGYNVTFNTNGGSAITRQTVDPGKKAIKPTDPTKEGFTFSGWYSNSALTIEYYFDTPVKADMILYAKWTETIIETPLISFAAFIQGFEDNTFRGDALITREQFIAILYWLKNTLSQPSADKNNPSFKDVLSNRWSYDAIEWANKANIITANAEGVFNPNQALIRADMAVMLVKADELTEMAENTFSDLDDHEACDDILKAVKAGIFTGYPDGSFKPNGSTTRNEAVTALVRYLLGQEPTDIMWKDLVLNFGDIPASHWTYKYVVLAVNGYQ